MASPLKRNPTTGELFLQLRNHPHIVLTPPRLEDAPFIPPLLNDPRVYVWLKGPPYPYQLSDAEAWLAGVKQTADAVIRELEGADPNAEPIIVDACPVRTIRQINADGTDVFLGDICIDRWGFPIILDENARPKDQLVKDNYERKAGDPNIIWTIGDYLAPSHHGQGIMSDALSTLLNDWGIPRMRVGHIIATTHKGNVGSVRVFEKNGFRMVGTVDDYEEVRGQLQSFHVVERRPSA
ncbi:hypothetical protein HGRIS_008354 [Hohenbuehelia grisea]|uniref:N-acetyltransferase domain-containing protein n=1 Tax=Hohenbuehelia grisea TaxID=104357 RepID=A0ABR3J855_9AGAR